jgi:hypothetical protein
MCRQRTTKGGVRVGGMPDTSNVKYESRFWLGRLLYDVDEMPIVTIVHGAASHRPIWRFAMILDGGCSFNEVVFSVRYVRVREECGRQSAASPPVGRREGLWTH